MGDSNQRPAVTVFGSSQPMPGSAAYEQARTLGHLLAQAGFDVINGGYTGTMQGVSQGSSKAGGKAIGITCALFDGRRSGGNRYLAEAIHTPDLLARLRGLTDRGLAYVVLGGGIGTLLELFLVWNQRAIAGSDRPCILVGAHWQRVMASLRDLTEVRARHTDLLHMVDTPAEAVEYLTAALQPRP